MSASLPCVVRHSRRLSAALWRRGPRPQPYTSSHPACFTSIAAPDAIQSAIQSALDSDDIVVDDDSSSTAATAASAAAMAALSADYVPRWRYQHSSIRQPSRSDILQSYRAMLRLTRKTAQGAQQLWAKQRSEHWQGAPKPEQQQSPQQAAKTALQLFEYSDKWLVEVRQQYRAHQHEKDEQRIAALQLDALEYVALLNANMEHSVSPNTSTASAQQNHSQPTHNQACTPQSSLTTHCPVPLLSSVCPSVA